MQTGATSMENNMEVPQKIKNRIIILSSNSIIEYLPKDHESINSKRHMHPYVYSSIIYNSQIMEAAQVSINRRMDKQKMYARIHTLLHIPQTITQL